MSALVPRDDFPALAELTYLNTASVGLVPAPVQEKAEEFDRDVAVRGTVALDEEAEIAVFEGTRASAARLIGAEPDEVAITASATLALGQIAWFLRPGRGDNVVSVDLEFPSSTYPWLRIAEDTGAEVRLVQDGQSRRDSPSRTSPPWSTGARRSCASATCSTRRDTVSTRRGSRRSHTSTTRFSCSTRASRRARSRSTCVPTTSTSSWRRRTSGFAARSARRSVTCARARGRLSPAARRLAERRSPVRARRGGHEAAGVGAQARVLDERLRRGRGPRFGHRILPRRRDRSGSRA